MAVRIISSRVRRRLFHCTEPYSTAIWLPAQTAGKNLRRWVWVRSSWRAACGKLHPSISGAALPVCWMPPPPGPSSSAQPGLSSMVCSAYWRVQPPLPPAERMAHLRQAAAACPPARCIDTAVIFALSFSCSALHSLTSSAHTRFSFYHTMPARCGQAKTK